MRCQPPPPSLPLQLTVHWVSRHLCLSVCLISSVCVCARPTVSADDVTVYALTLRHIELGNVIYYIRSCKHILFTWESSFLEYD